MLLIRTWKEFTIKLFPINRWPIQEMWFERQKNTKNIPGTFGVRTDICWIQVYSATAVQTGGFNRSFISWYRVQEPLKMVTHKDVTKYCLCIESRHCRTFKIISSKKFDTESSHVSGHLYKSLPNNKSPLHLYIQFHTEHHMIFLPNC